MPTGDRLRDTVGRTRDRVEPRPRQGVDPAVVRRHRQGRAVSDGPATTVPPPRGSGRPERRRYRRLPAESLTANDSTELVPRGDLLSVRAHQRRSRPGTGPPQHPTTGERLRGGPQPGVEATSAIGIPGGGHQDRRRRRGGGVGAGGEQRDIGDDRDQEGHQDRPGMNRLTRTGSGERRRGLRSARRSPLSSGTAAARRAITDPSRRHRTGLPGPPQRRRNPGRRTGRRGGRREPRGASDLSPDDSGGTARIAPLALGTDRRGRRPPDGTAGPPAAPAGPREVSLVSGPSRRLQPQRRAISRESEAEPQLPPRRRRSGRATASEVESRLRRIRQHVPGRPVLARIKRQHARSRSLLSRASIVAGHPVRSGRGHAGSRIVAIVDAASRGHRAPGRRARCHRPRVARRARRGRPSRSAGDRARIWSVFGDHPRHQFARNRGAGRPPLRRRDGRAGAVSASAFSLTHVRMRCTARRAAGTATPEPYAVLASRAGVQETSTASGSARRRP